jgi:hypothetical protein
MPGRHVFEVTGLPDGSWALCESGKDAIGKSFADQAEALVHAERLARAAQPSKIIVENADGTIDHERVFGTDVDILASHEKDY